MLIGVRTRGSSESRWNNICGSTVLSLGAQLPESVLRVRAGQGTGLEGA